MNIIINVLKWIPLNIVSVFGILQALIKLLKELVTAVLNFLTAIVVLIPNVNLGKVNVVVTKTRDFIEKADAGVQVWKDKILSWVHAK